jgi:hypothetical protein
MFWFYVPVQSITLEHVFCSDLVFPSKVLHWNMSYVLILRSRPQYYIGTCHMFWFFYVPVQSITLEHVFCSDFTFPPKLLHWNMSYVLILRSSPNYYIGTCLVFWFYAPVQSITLEHVLCSNFTFLSKILHWNMSYVLILRSCPQYYIGTCNMFWFFTFPSKVLHWNMSSILILRSRPSYCIGTCHMFWCYVPVQTITLEHVYVLILLSRSKYYIGTCPMFWFYPPVQTITLEHVLCSNFTFPFKILHWNM